MHLLLCVLIDGAIRFRFAALASAIAINREQSAFMFSIVWLRLAAWDY